MPVAVRLVLPALLLLTIGLAPPLMAEQSTETQPDLDHDLTELDDYQALMDQVSQERQGAVGFQSRALGKQLVSSREAYRKVLWQYVDDVLKTEDAAAKGKHLPIAQERLAAELLALKEAIAESDTIADDLETRIADGKRNTFALNQAPAKERLTALQWRLSLVRRYQESLLYDLVHSAQRAQALGVPADEALALARERVSKQANTLSGLIGLNEDKMLQLEKKKAVVRSESDTGKKLISDTALVNLEIQEFANRLQSMATLLEDLEQPAALYKKTVIQARNTLSGEVLDRRVLSHLATEWWLDLKTWFKRQGPTLLGNVITFLGILIIAYLLAKLAKRLVSLSIRRTRPNMSELAKKFLVNITAKIIMLIGLLYALSQLGVQIAPLLAGLGIMGFVIGFALQETLANFASGLMILIYRPFDVGDKIRVAGLEGRVQEMTLVTTTLYTSANHHLTVPNNKIWKDIIHNITSQPQVRMDLNFSVPFNADSAVVLQAIAEEIQENPIVLDDKDRYARIAELGEKEVKYLARFWVTSDNVDEAKWSIAEGVKQRFDAKGVSQNIIGNLSVGS